MKPEKSWLISKPIAHRGFHTQNTDCPENSLKSFERALLNDFAIELDVHVLTDGEIVVFHDDNLQRMTGHNKLIEHCNSQKIKKLKLLDSNERIPLLNQVLEFIDGKVPLLIEIKNEKEPGSLEIALYKTLIQYKGPYAIQSFNPYSLKWFRANAPYIQRGQLSGSFKGENLAFYKVFLLKYLLVNFLSVPSFINYNIKDLPNWAISWQKIKGIPILGWTARTFKEYKDALKWCDNIIFEGFNPLEESKNELEGHI